ncbi:Pumilio-like 2 [Porphyridium purpureum]|uniref:Pumilio-like 2 n=1 Tax=Porphyridium purpureum TaxID=35688 RepID=A0A5J4YWI9_PORPP|nr:Pumilio-like 2 [Porphyridium purpureum]|eukprot:POR1845..scf227_4
MDPSRWDHTSAQGDAVHSSLPASRNSAVGFEDSAHLLGAIEGIMDDADTPVSGTKQPQQQQELKSGTASPPPPPAISPRNASGAHTPRSASPMMRSIGDHYQKAPAVHSLSSSSLLDSTTLVNSMASMNVSAMPAGVIGAGMKNGSAPSTSLQQSRNASYSSMLDSLGSTNASTNGLNSSNIAQAPNPWTRSLEFIPASNRGTRTPLAGAPYRGEAATDVPAQVQKGGVHSSAAFPVSGQRTGSDMEVLRARAGVSDLDLHAGEVPKSGHSSLGNVTLSAARETTDLDRQRIWGSSSGTNANFAGRYGGVASPNSNTPHSQSGGALGGAAGSDGGLGINMGSLSTLAASGANLDQIVEHMNMIGIVDPQTQAQVLSQIIAQQQLMRQQQQQLSFTQHHVQHQQHQQQHPPSQYAQHGGGGFQSGGRGMAPMSGVDLGTSGYGSQSLSDSNPDQPGSFFFQDGSIPTASPEKPSALGLGHQHTMEENAALRLQMANLINARQQLFEAQMMMALNSPSLSGHGGPVGGGPSASMNMNNLSLQQMYAALLADPAAHGVGGVGSPSIASAMLAAATGGAGGAMTPTSHHSRKGSYIPDGGAPRSGRGGGPRGDRNNMRSQRSPDGPFGAGDKKSMGGGSDMHPRSAILEDFRATSGAPTSRNNHQNGGGLGMNMNLGDHNAMSLYGGYSTMGLNASAPVMGAGGGANAPYREWHLEDIRGHVVEFATDQHGSRFIQQKLESARVEELRFVLNEALSEMQLLMTDVFGNYVVQKLLEHGQQADAVPQIFNELRGRMLTLSLHMYGCRVVQKALEVLGAEERAVLVAELNGHVLKCIRDQNGNHVIQKSVELVAADKVQFIVDAITGQAVSLAEHSYGCRVVQRVLEFGADFQKAPIRNEIMKNIHKLISDQYGNYVIQHIVEHGTEQERAAVTAVVFEDVVALSQHKFASNVVERCLQHGNAMQRKQLIEVLIEGDGRGPPGVSPLSSLVRDNFGNYVVQRVLDVAEPQQRERVVNILRVQMNLIKKYSYGKHILARLEPGWAGSPRVMSPYGASSMYSVDVDVCGGKIARGLLGTCCVAECPCCFYVFVPAVPERVDVYVIVAMLMYWNTVGRFSNARRVCCHLVFRHKLDMKMKRSARTKRHHYFSAGPMPLRLGALFSSRFPVGAWAFGRWSVWPYGRLDEWAFKYPINFDCFYMNRSLRICEKRCFQQ